MAKAKKQTNAVATADFNIQLPTSKPEYKSMLGKHTDMPLL